MWDLIKMEIRSSTICFSKIKAKKRREDIKKAMVSAEILEKQLSTSPSDDLIKQYHENRSYIEAYNNEKANGAILRSKAAWAEFGERNSKFFLNLEKRNHNMKCITKLIDDDNKEITEADKILEYEETFYKNLYTKTIKNANELQEQETAANNFKDETLPKISDANKNLCDTEITIQETGIALKN